MSPTGVCWANDQLLRDPGLNEVSRGDKAFRALPRRRSSFPQHARAPYGAIRRVELPPGSPKMVALTFDLCEQPDEVAGYDVGVVEVLRRLNVQATFFSGGK